MSARNSAYSPLLQLNSDSEGSESEELHLDHQARIVNRISNSQNVSPEKMFNGQKPNTINYELLHPDGDTEATLIKFQPTSDEVSILKPSKKIEFFSTSRKICFLLSLLLCVFTTVVFLWGLPCNEGTCLSLSRSKTIAWEQTFESLEIFGPIELISDALGNSQYIVFFTKKLPALGNDYRFHDVKREPGLMTLNGDNGSEKWNITLEKDPTDMDCNMIDVNLDKINDCLVIGSGFLKAIDSATGAELWDLYQHLNTGLVPEIMNFPVVIYDLNGDSVNDMIAFCSFPNGKGHSSHSGGNAQNFLIVISGKTGGLLNRPINTKVCSSVQNVTVERDSILSYKCFNLNGNGVLEKFNLSSLFSTLINDYSPGKLALDERNNLRDHSMNLNSVTLNGYRVIVENQGRCPGNCNTAVDIKDEKTDYKNNTLYTYNDKNTYCVIPVVFKRHSPAFIVLKFWKWQSRDIISNGISMKRAAASEETANSRLSSFEGIENLDNVMMLESQSHFKRAKRGAKGLEKTMFQPSLKDSNLYLHVISETIVAITFNRSHPFVRNMTQNKMVQICKYETCEPDLRDQTRSLLTADLNGDGRDEFISFSSGYTHDVSKMSQSGNESWKLESVIKVATL